jgi:hypothetical protein
MNPMIIDAPTICSSLLPAIPERMGDSMRARVRIALSSP